MPGREVFVVILDVFIICNLLNAESIRIVYVTTAHISDPATTSAATHQTYPQKIHGPRECSNHCIGVKNFQKYAREGPTAVFTRRTRGSIGEGQTFDLRTVPPDSSATGPNSDHFEILN